MPARRIPLRAGRVFGWCRAPSEVDCATALDFTDQDPTINQMMASQVLQVIHRMVAGDCPFMALYQDMDLGTVTTTYVTPEAVERTVGTYVE